MKNLIKSTAVGLGLLGLLAVTAPTMAGDAQTQAQIMRQKLSTKQSGPVVPTGYEVPGCTHYVHNDLAKGVKQICDLSDVSRRDVADRFWNDLNARQGS